MNEKEKQKKAVLKALDADDEIICGKCNYGWIPRVKKPKACPRCKSRLDCE